MTFYDKKGEILLIFYWRCSFNARKEATILYIINKKNIIKMLYNGCNGLLKRTQRNLTAILHG